MLQSPYLATCPAGCELALFDELWSLGLTPSEAVAGGVWFGVGDSDGARAAMWSRTAGRLVRMWVQDCCDATDDLGELCYSLASSVPWEAHMSASLTFRVDQLGGGRLGGAHHALLRVKDAVADRFRGVEGKRPNVDRDRPDRVVVVRFVVGGARVRVHLGLDLTAGVPLSRRSVLRSGPPVAPLRENLAAALLRMAGWWTDVHTACGSFVDPMCGSGSLLQEAAHVAHNMAPGRARELAGHGRDPCESLVSPELWLTERHAARDAVRDPEVNLFGADMDPRAVDTARSRLRGVGVGAAVRLEVRRLGSGSWPSPEVRNGRGVLVVNPPFGVRLGHERELLPLYERLGDVLRRDFPGWETWILSGSPQLLKRVGLKSAARHPVSHGNLSCTFARYPIAQTATEGVAPSWRRLGEEFTAFERRLRKNLKRLTPWAKEGGLDVFRLYDLDTPEFPVTVDRYGDEWLLQERHSRQARGSRARAEADVRLLQMRRAVASAVEVDVERIRLRVRDGSGPVDRHTGEQGGVVVLCEGDMRVEVNLRDRLDTGYYAIDRKVRRAICKLSNGAHMLNLFSHTCVASVASAMAGAKTTVNVDLSNTFLRWGERNMALNGISSSDHQFVRADCLAWVRRCNRSFDVIFLGPPTGSVSKGMEEDFLLQRDAPALLHDTAQLLRPGGTLWFTTHQGAGFEFPGDVFPPGRFSAEERGDMKPRDFPHSPLRVWRVQSVR